MVELSIQDLLPFEFGYNHIDGISRSTKPYDEISFLLIISLYLQVRKFSSEDELSTKQKQKLEKLVNRARKGALNHFLDHSNFTEQKLMKDGNCATKAIS
jgi:hypothetical protein